MKAMAFTEHGDVNVLRMMDVPDPVPAADEVLIEVEACSINHLDLWTREGWKGLNLSMPHILGCDVVGRVVQLGSEVKTVREGARVVVAPGQLWGEAAKAYEGRESLSPDYKVVGLHIPGGYAQYMVAKAEEVFAVADVWTPTQWAAAPLVYLTAWHMLIGRANMRPKDVVLIHAAGSGIGSAAIQLAKHCGARVIATSTSDAKLARAKELGADEVINTKANPKFHRIVREMTDGRGCDIVFEHVGPATWDGSMSSLASGGRVVFCGATTGPQVTIDLRFAFTRQLSVLGSYMGDKHELASVLRLLEDKSVTPVVDSVFPLEQAREAHQKVASRDIFGKVVLTIT